MVSPEVSLGIAWETQPGQGACWKSSSMGSAQVHALALFSSLVSVSFVTQDVIILGYLCSWDSLSECCITACQMLFW